MIKGRFAQRPFSKVLLYLSAVGKLSHCYKMKFDMRFVDFQTKPLPPIAYMYLSTAVVLKEDSWKTMWFNAYVWFVISDT